MRSPLVAQLAASVRIVAVMTVALGVVYPLAVTAFAQLAVEKGVVDHNIELFRRDMKRGTILRLRNTSHGGFLTDPAQLAIFVPAMREFLLAP